MEELGAFNPWADIHVIQRHLKEWESDGYLTIRKKCPDLEHPITAGEAVQAAGKREELAANQQQKEGNLQINDCEKMSRAPVALKR